LTIAAGSRVELSGAAAVTSDGNDGVAVVNQGVLAVLSPNQELGSIRGDGVVEIGDAASLTTASLRQTAASVGRGAKLTIRPISNTSTLKILSIAPGDTRGTLDITDNAFVIDYTAAPSSAATVRSQLLAGRGGAGFGATWNGPGITSSAAAEANVKEPESRSVGYAENITLPLGPYMNFYGQTVDDSSILMAYTRTGDANLDGVVDDADVTIVSATYAPGVPQPHWALGDFDYNGFVDDADVTLLGAFYDPSAEPLMSRGGVSGEGVAAVPEPGTITLIFAGLAAVLAARTVRRKVCEG
jgi:hypothetical protein